MNIKLLFKSLIITSTICACHISLAATEIINAKIIDVAPDKDYGVIYITLSSTQRGTTACSLSNYNNRYQISDLNSPINKALLSVALTALASGKTVKAVGDDTCTGREGIETLRLITFIQ